MIRTMWAYWHQGEANAPFLVRQCLSSWRRCNPDWKLIVIDESTVQDWCDLGDFQRRTDIGLQALTDILRVNLLSRYGGAWIDATLYCQRPLNEWLPRHVDDGFFAFASERTDRLLTTWFLYGEPDSGTLDAWRRAIDAYWRAHRFAPVGYFRRQALRKLMSLRKRGFVGNDVWFSTLFTNGLKIYPYPVNMYLFERALRGQPELRRRWEQRHHLFDEPAERLQNVFGMNQPRTPESEYFLAQAATPVHKLNWRQDSGHAEAGSNLEMLLGTAQPANGCSHD